MEGLTGGADSAARALRVGGVVCAVCGSNIQALKRGSRVAECTHSDSSNSYPNKPVSRSLTAEFKQEADKDEEDSAWEISDSDACSVDVRYQVMIFTHSLVIAQFVK
jgi:hypothetical protein